MEIKQPGASSFMNTALSNRLVKCTYKHPNEHTETQTGC